MLELNRLKQLTAAFISSLGLVSCGGNVSGIIGPTVKVEDAAIYGALLVDASNRVATMSGAGIYQFIVDGVAVTPSLPIKVTSQNLIVNGAVNVTNIGGVWYSWQGGTSTNPTTKNKLTFQDLDGDGTFTLGVDVVYNGAFNVSYAPAGQTQLNLNPVTALIPANWNGNTPVAGISASLLQTAADPTKGIQASNNADLKRAAALVAAITDTLAMNNTSATTIASVVTAIAGASVNLLATTSDAQTLQNSTAAISTAVQAVAGAQAANLAVNIHNLAGSTSLANGNYEAIVKVSQDNVDVLKTPSPSNFSTLVAAVSTADSQIEQGQTNVQSGNSLSTRVAELRLVPYCDMVVGNVPVCNLTNVADWLTFGRLSNFSLTLLANGDISFASSAGSNVNNNNVASSFFAANSFTVPYATESAQWIYTAGNASMMKISVGTGFTDPASGRYISGNLLQICKPNPSNTAQNNCVPYYLANASGVCNLVKTNNVVDTVLLAKINALQASNRQVTCQ